MQPTKPRKSRRQCFGSLCRIPAPVLLPAFSADSVWVRPDVESADREACVCSVRLVRALLCMQGGQWPRAQSSTAQTQRCKAETMVPDTWLLPRGM